MSAFQSKEGVPLRLHALIFEVQAQIIYELRFDRYVNFGELFQNNHQSFRSRVWLSPKFFFNSLKNVKFVSQIDHCGKRGLLLFSFLSPRRLTPLLLARGAPPAPLSRTPNFDHFAATGVSSNTRPCFAASAMSPRRKASRTLSSFLASSTDRYGD